MVDRERGKELLLAQNLISEAVLVQLKLAHLVYILHLFNFNKIEFFNATQFIVKAFNFVSFWDWAEFAHLLVYLSGPGPATYAASLIADLGLIDTFALI